MALDEDRRENVRLLRESAAAVAVRGDLSRVRGERYRQPGFSREVWRRMAELGWLGLLLPEDRGGAGLGAAELIALAEELGAALAPEPFVSALLAVRALEGDQLAAALSGERVVLAAWQERPRSLDEGRPETSFDGGRVTGRKVFVPMAAGADAFLVTTGSGAVVVGADDPGLRIETAATQDGGHWGTLVLDGARGEPARGGVEVGFDDAVLATAALLLGVAEAALERTIEYLGLRQQFGVRIGTFQALQHRAVDMRLATTLARASLEDAAAILDAAGGGTPRAKAAASRAKARANESAMLVAQQAVQLHGGIGYTDEHDIGLFLRKAVVLAPSFGDSALHRRRFARWTAAANEGEAAPERTTRA